MTTESPFRYSANPPHYSRMSRLLHTDAGEKIKHRYERHTMICVPQGDLTCDCFMTMLEELADAVNEHANELTKATDKAYAEGEDQGEENVREGELAEANANLNEVKAVFMNFRARVLNVASQLQTEAAKKKTLSAKSLQLTRIVEDADNDMKELVP